MAGVSFLGPEPHRLRAKIEIEIEILDDASEYAAFVFPQRRALLSAIATPWVAIGARWRGAPVGMALGTIADGRAWLDSVMVVASLRRQGIARALLAALGDHARAAGAARIDTQYSSFAKGRVALEALLAGSGWEPPTLIDIQLVGHAGAMADCGGAWRPVQRALREPGDYSVEPFSLRGAEDDAAIDALLEAAPGLAVPDPRARPALDHDVSVTIRHGDTLIGWIAGEMLTRSIGFGTLVSDAPSIYYSGSLLADGHRKAMMLVGYYRAFSRQAELHGPASRAIYRTHPAATTMYNFTRARFEPMALHVEERFEARLPLSAPLDSPTTSQELVSC